MPTNNAVETAYQRRWLILGVIAIAQLMVVLDGTVVNIALPSAQTALDFSDGQRQWIITAYALSFGGLLLLGGKLADLFGRKAMFVTGLLGFAVASAIGGAANSFEMLVTARAAQGVFGAILAPAGLALLTTTFPDKGERGKAFGIYGAIIGSGGAVGLLLGGVLTEYLSWRWCMYVNLILAAVGVVGGILLLTKEVITERPKLDIPGTISVCVAMFAIVLGFSNADTHGWSAPSTWGLLILGVAMLAAFVALQARVANPLLPLRIVLDRNRGGSFLAMLLVMIGMSGVFLFLTYYLQVTLHYSAVATGLAFLPMMAGAMVSGILANVVILPRTGPRPMVVVGMLLTAVGTIWLTGIGLDSSYVSAILGPLIIVGVGISLVVSPSMNTATFRVPAGDSGVASALANTQQQIGTSLGTALLNTIAVSATTSYIASKAAGAATDAHLASLAQVHGYTTAFWWTAGILVAGAAISGVILRGGPLPQDDSDDPEAILPELDHDRVPVG